MFQNMSDIVYLNRENKQASKHSLALSNKHMSQERT